MLHTERPLIFNPQFDTVGCFLEYNNKILLLERQSHKPQPGAWGLPSGKIEQNETERKAMVRELEQETGISIDPGSLYYFMKVFVQYPEYDFTHHMFYRKFTVEPKISINAEEHKSYQWLEPEKALRSHKSKRMALVPDFDACIRLFYKL